MRYKYSGNGIKKLKKERKSMNTSEKTNVKYTSILSEKRWNRDKQSD